MAETASLLSPCPICGAACRSIRDRDPVSCSLHDRRNWRRRNGDADYPANSDPQSCVHGLDCDRDEPEPKRQCAGDLANHQPLRDRCGGPSIGRHRCPRHRLQPSTRQHDAFPDRQLHHFAVRHFSDAKLEAIHVRPVRCGDQDIRRRLCADRMGVVQRPAHADLAEHGLVFDTRDLLRRRRQIDLCAPQPDGLRRHQPGARDGTERPLSRRNPAAARR